MKTNPVEMVSLETLLAETATEFEARVRAAHKVTVDARDTTTAEKGSLKSLGKFYYACKARLQRLKDAGHISATETDIDYIRRVTGDGSKKPVNTHASTLAKCFGELVVFTAAIPEATYDRAKADWLEALVPIYDEVKKSLAKTPSDQLRDALRRHDSLAEAVEIVTAALTDTARAKTAKKELVALLRELRPKAMPAWEDIEDKVREWLSHPALAVAIQNEIGAFASAWTNAEFAGKFAEHLQLTADLFAQAPVHAGEIPAAAPKPISDLREPISESPDPQSAPPDFAGWIRTAYAGLLDEAGIADVLPVIESYHAEHGRLPADAPALSAYADTLAVA